jgi:hypothetical protein
MFPYLIFREAGMQSGHGYPLFREAGIQSGYPYPLFMEAGNPTRFLEDKGE